MLGPGHNGVVGQTDGVNGTSQDGSWCRSKDQQPREFEGLFATNDGGGLAAFFLGGVQIQGDFTVFAGTKSAAVPHPDGSHRLL